MQEKNKDQLRLVDFVSLCKYKFEIERGEMGLTFIGRCRCFSLSHGESSFNIISTITGSCYIFLWRWIKTEFGREEQTPFANFFRTETLKLLLSSCMAIGSRVPPPPQMFKVHMLFFLGSPLHELYPLMITRHPSLLGGNAVECQQLYFKRDKLFRFICYAYLFSVIFKYIFLAHCSLGFFFLCRLQLREY